MLIPYTPTKRCPECQQTQARSHAPAPPAGAYILDRDTAIVDADTGEIAVVYAVCAQSLANKLAASLRNVHWMDQYSTPSSAARLSGMAVVHNTFGYAPPAPLRRKWGCSRSQFNDRYPLAMERLAEFCRVSEHVFRTQAPDAYTDTAQAVTSIISSPWRIAGTPWTSGIINATAALPYHRDRGNVAKSWSAMIGCRKHVDGGLLHLVDYDVYLPIANGSITIFDGHSITHGVTPLNVLHPKGYRFTAVTYAKQMMSHCCADPAGEAHRAALRATQANDQRGKVRSADAQ